MAARSRKDPAPEVFISYSRSTATEAAGALKTALEAAGIPAFLDTKEVPIGGDFVESITEALLGARLFVAFVDDRYFTSWYCEKEWEMALAAWRHIAGARGDASTVAECLDAIVLAWDSELSANADRRIDALNNRRRNWPVQGDTGGLVDVITESLGKTTRAIGERLASLGILERIRSGFGGAAEIPEPASFAGLCLYPAEIPKLTLAERFVGRGESLRRLDRLLLPAPTRSGAGASLTASLKGGGGFGKTQLAAEYAHRFGPLWYPGGVFWIDASFEGKVDGNKTDAYEMALAEQHHGMLRELERHYGETVVDQPVPKTLTDMEAAGRKVAAELERAFQLLPPDKPALVIVDNVPEPGEGVPHAELSTYCPGRSHVTVVATSRAKLEEFESLDVDVLDDEPARALITQGLKSEVTSSLAEEGWHVIVDWVGRLPLMLTLLNQALMRNALSPQELVKIAESKASPTRVSDDQITALRRVIPLEKLRGVTEALMISYELHPEPEQAILRRLAWLAPEIYPELFFSNLDGGHRIGVLSSSFLQESAPVADAPAWSMHRVFGDFLRSLGDPDEDWLAAAEHLATHLKTNACADFRNREPMLSLVPLVHQLVDRAPSRPRGLESSVRKRAFRSLASEASALEILGRFSGRNEPISAAISASAWCLGCVDRNREPGDWARIQNKLGIVLKTLGERRGDDGLLEEAAQAYRSALQVRSRDRLPGGWAMTMHNLGIVLKVLGERRGDETLLEEAAQAYRSALEVRSRERSPDRWAMTQNTLGVVLKVLGERRGDETLLEEAAQAYRSALEVRTRKHLPDRWATTQNNLGIVLKALGERRGDETLLEEAVQAHRSALEVRTRKHLPDRWAMTQNNLGIVLKALGERRGDDTLLEKAIQAYRSALEVRTRKDLPDRWATTQNNLGSVLTILGARRDDEALLQQATEAYRSALEVRTRERLPEDWAMTQNNLGRVLMVLGARRNDEVLLEQATAAYRSALEVRTRERLPDDSAMTQNNLGKVLHVLGVRSDDETLLEAAAQAYRTALDVYTPERWPERNRIVRANLDDAQQAIQASRSRKGLP